MLPVANHVGACVRACVRTSLRACVCGRGDFLNSPLPPHLAAAAEGGGTTTTTKSTVAAAAAAAAASRAAAATTTTAAATTTTTTTQARPINKQKHIDIIQKESEEKVKIKEWTENIEEIKSGQRPEYMNVEYARYQEPQKAKST